MTALRESILLPLLFLTVSLLGGLRVGDTVRLIPPSLTALVLAVLLIGTLMRARILVPQAFLHGSRAALENLSGAVVLTTLFGASAQAINLLLPERGLLHAAFAVFLFCQLIGTNATGATRTGALRALAVLLGSLFVLRFIVVESLYAAGGGLLQRVLTALMSGATLGGIVYDPNAPVTGYMAFITLILYVVGLLLLPSAPATGALVRAEPRTPGLPTVVPLLLLLCSAACSRAAPEGGAASAEPARAPAADSARKSAIATRAQRNAALRRAQVWRQPTVAVAAANLKANPGGPGAFRESDVVECRLVLEPMGGTTPKFDCALTGGDVVRVKYGRGNPELHAEVVTTRLLSALGFGADRMFVIRQVTCAGCTSFPFHSLRCLAETGLERLCFPRGVDYARTTAFDYAVIERTLEGRRLESTPDEGWGWYEIDRIDPSAGGAPRAHVDALKLLAVLIAHWDNKAANQRLLCLPGGDLADGGCSRPFALLQDVGASFGPTKLDLQNWRAQQVWADARACRVSMEHLPWGGGTFPEQTISEEGRAFLAGLLGQMTADQVRDLFSGARIEVSEGITAEGRDPTAWAAAFMDKVRQIREAGPCVNQSETGS